MRGGLMRSFQPGLPQEQQSWVFLYYKQRNSVPFNERCTGDFPVFYSRASP
jgi:hypothetical protein